MSKEMEIIGIKEWASSMTLFDLKAKKNLGQSLEETIVMVHVDAVQNVLVDSGRLKNSLTYVVDKLKLEAEEYTNVEYAPFVELGTVKQAAQPFLQTAVNNNIGYWNGKMTAAIAKVAV